MNEHPNDPFDELMRRALHEQADRIEPADGLHEIRSRVSDLRPPGARRLWMLTAGAAVVGTAAAVGAFTVFDGSLRPGGDAEVAGPADTTTAPFASAEPTSPAPASQLPTPPGTAYSTVSPKVAPSERGKPEQVTTKAVPVYWLGKTVGLDTAPGYRLYRTWTRIKGRPAYEAVRLMATAKPTDPDYDSPWVGSTVGSVTRTKGEITVDFKELPQRRLEPSVATMASQQLVYTVQGAMDAQAPVRVTVQGRPISQLFGVETRQPLDRAQALDVQALIWIESPENGTVVRAPFEVTGIAAAHEAQLNWRIISERSRKVVAEGPTMTTEAFKLTPYSFTVRKLPAGSYTLEVFESSANDGRPTSTDTKTFHVK